MASKRRLRRKSCEGKARHSTWKGAEIAADIHYQRFRSVVFPYLCQFCKHPTYHIGHNPQMERRTNIQKRNYGWSG